MEARGKTIKKHRIKIGTSRITELETICVNCESSQRECARAEATRKTAVLPFAWREMWGCCAPCGAHKKKRKRKFLWGFAVCEKQIQIKRVREPHKHIFQFASHAQCARFRFSLSRCLYLSVPPQPPPLHRRRPPWSQLRPLRLLHRPLRLPHLLPSLLRRLRLPRRPLHRLPLVHLFRSAASPATPSSSLLLSLLLWLLLFTL